MKKKAIMQDLPFIEGKSYKTTFATGEGFLLTRIERKKEPDSLKLPFGGWLQKMKPNSGITHMFGIYDKSPALGECQLPLNIVRPEQIKIGEIEVCSKCGHPIKED